MERITADARACQGYGNCISVAPDVFDMDEDDKVVVRVEKVRDADRTHVEEAVGGCPMQALRIIEE